MNVIIVGTGNVAFVLAQLLKSAGHTIAEVYGRNTTSLSQLSGLTNAKICTDILQLTDEADLCLLAVSDVAISAIAKQLKKTKMLVVHTSGATSKEVLNRFESYGVFYPLQSLRKEEINQIPDIPFYVDANNEKNKNVLIQLASSTGNKVFVADDEQRLQLHLAAVLCSNFTNHLYALADFFCAKENIDFKNLLPIIKQTVSRLDMYSAAQMQTGPAIRNDVNTIQKHLELLTSFPHIRILYETLSNSIQAFSKEQHNS